MSNIAWPAALPGPLDQGMSYTPLFEPVLSTTMEAGAPKRRRRVSVVPETFECSLLISKAQVAALKYFISQTLAEVLPFEWKDFRDGSPMTYVFSKRPVYTLAAAGTAQLWHAQLQLITVP